MAIMKEYPGVQVTVECRGESLPEYDNDEEEPHSNSLTKYIEAKSGAEFTIQLRLHPPYPVHSVCFKLSLDGKCIAHRIVDELAYAKAKGVLMRNFQSVKSKIAEDQCIKQNFCFSELQVDDSDDQYMDDQLMKTLKNLGVISLSAHFIKDLKQVPHKDNGIDRKLSGPDTIPEKALKGKSLSHQAGYGTALNVPYASFESRTVYEYVSPKKLPFAVFNFKYRSIAALKSLLIIPRSPSPVPLENKDVKTLASEESQGLIRRTPEQEAASQNVKQETGIKRERNAINQADDDDDDELSFLFATKRPRHRITIDEAGVETIDLT